MILKWYLTLCSTVVNILWVHNEGVRTQHTDCPQHTPLVHSHHTIGSKLLDFLTLLVVVVTKTDRRPDKDLVDDQIHVFVKEAFKDR